MSQVTIPPETKKRYDLADKDLESLAPGHWYAYKNGLIDKGNAKPWDDGLGADAKARRNLSPKPRAKAMEKQLRPSLRQKQPRPTKAKKAGPKPRPKKNEKEKEKEKEKKKEKEKEKKEEKEKEKEKKKEKEKRKEKEKEKEEKEKEEKEKEKEEKEKEKEEAPLQPDGADKLPEVPPGKVRVWEMKRTFTFASGNEWQDCLLFKFTTDDNKVRQGVLLLNVRLTNYHHFLLGTATQVETCENEIATAPGLFLVFPPDWRRMSEQTRNRGSKRFIYAIRSIDADGDGKADTLQPQLLGFYHFNYKRSVLLEDSPLDFKTVVSPLFVPYIGNSTVPPILRKWRSLAILLALLESDRLQDPKRLSTSATGLPQTSNKEEKQTREHRRHGRRAGRRRRRGTRDPFQKNCKKKQGRLSPGGQGPPSLPFNLRGAKPPEPPFNPRQRAGSPSRRDAEGACWLSNALPLLLVLLLPVLLPSFAYNISATAPYRNTGTKSSK
eukprot:g59312.t1